MGAILKAIGGGNSHACSNLEEYLNREEKTREEDKIGLDCDPSSFNSDFRLERAKHLIDKDARAYLHFSLSYRDTDNLSKQEILEQAKKLVEGIDKFKGHQVAIICHSDKSEHPHAHIVVNAVNSETGKKLAFSKEDLAKAKELIISLDREKGLEQEFKTYRGLRSQKIGNYKTLEKGERGDKSIWKVAIKNAVVESMEQATSKDEFIKALNSKGYSVEWADNKKHITVLDQEGHKRRLSNIEKEHPELEGKLSKEGLEKGFSLNALKTRSNELSELKQKYKVKSLKDIREEQVKKELDSWAKHLSRSRSRGRGMER